MERRRLLEGRTWNAGMDACMHEKPRACSHAYRHHAAGKVEMVPQNGFTKLRGRTLRIQAVTPERSDAHHRHSSRVVQLDCQ